MTNNDDARAKALAEFNEMLFGGFDLYPSTDAHDWMTKEVQETIRAALSADAERDERLHRSETSYLRALNQQVVLEGKLATVTSELEAARNLIERVTQEARNWSCEAKGQRATVNEVGAVLGGIPDYGPIVSTVQAIVSENVTMKAELEALKDALLPLCEARAECKINNPSWWEYGEIDGDGYSVFRGTAADLRFIARAAATIASIADMVGEGK